MRVLTAIRVIAAASGLALCSSLNAQSPGVRQVEATSAASHRPNLTIPVDVLAAPFREPIARVMREATLVARAAPEEFDLGIYEWLLEHPDRASLAWRRLGIPCAKIRDLGQGRFGWADGEGTEVSWQTVIRAPNVHVWLAEGEAKLGPMVPAVRFRAVAILHHVRRADSAGRAVVTQETTIYLHTDSKAASLIARILGPAAPRLADQGAAQLLLFFSGLTRYFTEHPAEIESLLAIKR